MKPIVAVITDTSQQGPHVFHQAGDKYLQALRRCADVTPVMVPSFEDPLEVVEILNFAHGFLFTGGYSNIERTRYGMPPAPEDENQDPQRDKNSLTWLPQIIEAGLPMLGICRGFQELNVAYGGTLYPRLHEIEGRMDHREDKDAPVEVQYGLAHSVTLPESGRLAVIVGETEFMVNTVHGQGINRLAKELRTEATADDGTIEAVTVENADAFALAVQWHPEWKAWDNPQSVKIFEAFGEAARAYQRNKVTRP
jgi:putative glutamine amidotransferase